MPDSKILTPDVSYIMKGMAKRQTLQWLNHLSIGAPTFHNFSNGRTYKSQRMRGQHHLHQLRPLDNLPLFFV